MSPKPSVCPNIANFCSSPCAKHPGWSLDVFSDAIFGRLYCGKLGKAKIVELNKCNWKILGIPDDYLLGIVPASDTGTVEIAL